MAAMNHTNRRGMSRGRSRSRSRSRPRSMSRPRSRSRSRSRSANFGNFRNKTRLNYRTFLKTNKYLAHATPIKNYTKSKRPIPLQIAQKAERLENFNAPIANYLTYVPNNTNENNKRALNMHKSDISRVKKSLNVLNLDPNKYQIYEFMDIKDAYYNPKLLYMSDEKNKQLNKAYWVLHLFYRFPTDVKQDISKHNYIFDLISLGHGPVNIDPEKQARYDENAMTTTHPFFRNETIHNKHIKNYELGNTYNPLRANESNFMTYMRYKHGVNTRPEMNYKTNINSWKR
jgi:hypothetical protein